MLNEQNTRQYLKESDFENLFTQELGWDNHTQSLNITVDETAYQLTAIAQKRGMVVFECPAPGTDGRIPNKVTRRKIKKQVTKSVHENFIIYTDAEKTTQIWLWFKRRQGKPDAYFEHHYHKEQSGESLIQKLRTILFGFEEEDQIDIVEVTKRVQAAVYAEKVTKKFYDRFKKEHDAFLKFLNGIPDEEMQKWYVSVMLNRLMFIYFIEKKGFLNSDENYLQTKLTESQANGTNRYYKEFLCPLFFEGFAKPADERNSEIKRLLGKIPYLNGGIFQKHQLETLHGESINIPDKAFEQLFRFFAQYHWHLDDRPLRNDNEINPDVLGYIFEKYINQKQMGAYYTKEDITEYISKNTIIPFLFDKAKKACKIAFEGDISVWKLLQEDPDRYIYDAVKKGGEFDLPEEIAVGIDDVSKRTGWNTSASEEYALPTEIWREVVTRRDRYEHIQAILENGEGHDINDLITYNLDICKFAKHVIKKCEGPELLRAFWRAITEVTILDPTCGSGAFLFAALNILEPLYEACLDRMQVFLDELQHAKKKTHSLKYDDFRKTLEQIEQHPNRKYFILKSIIINNLYGVDIMDEAIEICKLRLFLKMVAQIEEVQQIEPLPDIDFNIQAGNTLVGFATYDEVKNAIKSKLDFNDTMNRLEEKAEDIEERFTLFRQQQTELGGDVTPTDKQELQEELTVLEGELNRYLAGEYRVDPNKKTDYQNWLVSHKPFHWFITFYGILKKGGFDVIIGNPPYVEYSKVKKDYTIKGYETESCGNLYAYVMERGTVLNFGRTGWIVPISWVSTNRMDPVRNVVARSHPVVYTNNHADRPGALFTGVHQKLTIVFCAKGSPAMFTTEFCRCYSKEGERENLFKTLTYHYLDWSGGVIRKFSDDVEVSILRKISQKPNSITTAFKTTRLSNTHPFYLNQRLMMWVKCFLASKKSNEYKTYYPTYEFSAKELSAVFNSNLFFWFWETKGDCWHLTKGDMDNFHIDLAQFSDTNRKSLIQLAETLECHLEENKKYVGTKQTDYEYYHKKSKHIIDDIDRVLRQHYGFTDEELDFIINYAIKYRMGLGN